MERADPSATHRMKPVPATTPRSLLIHDGELADVRALLVSLKIPFEERLGAESVEDRRSRWDLVIASAKRILDLQLPWTSSPPIQIAILSHDARTLRSSLRRTGTTLMVRRPFHPAALRALVLHSLYRGPEKRRAARANVGAPARMKFGWRHRHAILVDLSASGCRLMTDRPIERGKAFRLEISSQVAGGRALAVAAHVVQCIASADPALGRYVISASFDSVDARPHAQLNAAVATHAEGPAVRDGAPPIAGAAATTAAEPIAGEPAQPDAEQADLALDDLELDLGPLDEEAARVLMGRDLSRGGMRIDPDPRLALGMKLQLAVHAETRELPLILHAVVDRDDGERGLVLRFCDLSAEITRYLDYVIHALPLVIDDDDDEGCLIAELVEAADQRTSIRTLVRVVKTARGAAGERDDVGAHVTRSRRPSQHARAVAAVPNAAPRAASGVPSANAAESTRSGRRPGHGRAPRSAAGAPPPCGDRKRDRAREARSPRSSSRRRDRPPRPRACRRSRDRADWPRSR